MAEGHEQDLKHLKKYVGTNHSNNETREREKVWGEQNFSKLRLCLLLLSFPTSAAQNLPGWLCEKGGQ